MPKHALRTATALALIAAISVIAASLLMPGPGGATAFNTDASAPTAPHIPIPAQYTAQCSNGTAVPNPTSNVGLVSDCAALLASKDTLEGTTGNLDWSVNRAISDWEGVTTANNRVSKLELDEQRLNGRIPSELGNLANLKTLDLEKNYLKDAIPSELGNLDNLTQLFLSNNRLTAIPAELGNLANLTILDLSRNYLTGEIPSELGDLNNLTRLDLNYNLLTGEIPSELGNLSNLTHLWLGFNDLTGNIPAELGNLNNLESLCLYGNQFARCIPASLREILGGSHLGGLPYCAATTAATPTATSVSYDALMSKIIALETQQAELVSALSVIESQLAELANRLTALEGGSAIAPPTPTPTATPSPTPTSVAGTSGDDACITEMREIVGSVIVVGSWSSACLSTNSPNNRTYYARFYTFTLSAASEVTITLSSNATAPYLFLREGAWTGGAIIRETGSATATTATITITLSAGSYTIEASTWESETPGDFTLELDITR